MVNKVFVDIFKRAFVPPLISRAYCSEKFCEDNKSTKAITKLKDP